MKNNAFKKYFRLNLKRSITPALIYLIIYSLIYLISLLTMKGIEYEGSMGYYASTTNVGLIITALAFSAYIDPVFNAKYLMNKKAIDNIYSLPITRNQIMLSKLFTGIIRVLIPFTITYLLGILICIFRFPTFNFIYYLPLYFILVVLFIFIYIFNYFFLTQANKINDGIMFMLFGNGLLFIFFATLAEILLAIDIFPNYSYDSLLSIGLSVLPAYSFISYGNYFNKLINMEYHFKHQLSIPEYIDYFEKYSEFDPIPLILIIILGIICLVLLLILNKRRKPENAEEVSHSYFGYRIVIPYSMACLMILFSVGKTFITSIPVIIIVSVMYIVLHLVYYRTFKFPTSRWIILAGILLLSLL